LKLGSSLRGCFRKEATLKIQELDKERVGFLLEGAGAATLTFQRGRTSEGELTRWGAWPTAGYRFDKPRLDFLGVGRYQRDSVGEQNCSTGRKTGVAD
jgi:hypothetical protein